MTVRMQADDFFNAYRILGENNEAFFAHADKSDKNGKAFGSVPAMGITVVCLAFSVELYIKDIYSMLDMKAPRGRDGHNILKLYAKLPKPIKREIFAHDAISKNPWATKGSILLPKKYKGISSAYHGFLYQVKSISDGFEKWRYSYENGNLKYEEWFALAFIDAVKAVADAIQAQSAL